MKHLSVVVAVCLNMICAAGCGGSSYPRLEISPAPGPENSAGGAPIASGRAAQPTDGSQGDPAEAGSSGARGATLPTASGEEPNGAHTEPVAPRFPRLSTERILEILGPSFVFSRSSQAPSQSSPLPDASDNSASYWSIDGAHLRYSRALIFDAVVDARGAISPMSRELHLKWSGAIEGATLVSATVQHRVRDLNHLPFTHYVHLSQATPAVFNADSDESPAVLGANSLPGDQAANARLEIGPERHGYWSVPLSSLFSHPSYTLLDLHPSHEQELQLDLLTAQGRRISVKLRFQVLLSSNSIPLQKLLPTSQLAVPEWVSDGIWRVRRETFENPMNYPITLWMRANPGEGSGMVQTNTYVCQGNPEVFGVEPPVEREQKTATLNISTLTLLRAPDHRDFVMDREDRVVAGQWIRMSLAPREKIQLKWRARSSDDLHERVSSQRDTTEDPAAAQAEAQAQAAAAFLAAKSAQRIEPLFTSMFSPNPWVSTLPPVPEPTLVVPPLRPLRLLYGPWILERRELMGTWKRDIGVTIGSEFVQGPGSDPTGTGYREVMSGPVQLR